MSELFKLSEEWEDIRNGSKLLIYGVGRIGRRVIPTIMKEFDILFLIDKNNKGTRFLGLEITNIDEVLDRIRDEHLKIVVTTMKGAYDDIASDLSEKGLRENIDFCLFERFAQEWNLRWNNKCVLAKIDTVITSRCTLKCRNCNMFISYASSHEDFRFDDLKKNFDVFFENVDFVYEYTLLGGEPFLHKDLARIISYLAERYGDRIGIINLISNGTIIPNNEVIELMKKYSMTVHISDYTSAVPYNKKIGEVVDFFKRNGIEYYVIPNNEWKDVMYPNKDYTAADPRRHMLVCGHSTHSVDNGKLYWCDPAFAAECFTGFCSQEGDSLDLKKNKMNNSKYDASLNILRYLLGDVNERGYMSFCEKCAGVGRDNEEIIKAGVQVVEGER